MKSRLNAKEHYRAISAGAGAVFVLCAIYFSAPKTTLPGKSVLDTMDGASYPQADCPIVSNAQPQVLAFKHRTGYTYQMLCKAVQDSYFAKHLVNHAETETTVSIKTVKLYDDGSAVLDGTFTASEHSLAAAARSSLPFARDDINKVAFAFKQESKGRFSRDTAGKYTVNEGSAVPVVRGCPVFPQSTLKSGDTWQAEGNEAEDFSRILGLDDPLIVPFTARYKFLGVTDGSSSPVLCVIYAERVLHYENAQGDDDTGGKLPSEVSGLCRRVIYWDNERGEVHHYTEDFALEVKTLYGEVYSFRGTSQGKSQSPDTSDVSSVQDTIADLGLENVTVKRSAEGLTISMERIQFLAESTMLLESEKAKLRKIADIISPYSNDIMVTGHTARSGPVSEQQQISEGRARSVAEYLIEIGARDRGHIFTQGKGATEAIATNDTAEGRALNRRVEITLMD